MLSFSLFSISTFQQPQVFLHLLLADIIHHTLHINTMTICFFRFLPSWQNIQSFKNFTRIHHRVELSAKSVEFPLSLNGQNSFIKFLYLHHYPDQHQHLISCCQSHIPPLQRNCSKFVDVFLSYLVNRQTM